ncbi:MAG: hypothetical protein A3F67_06045 [Verrucomicrobia bacterium RIFCSPHIGHO2_12_FULL_41_10]|nr:MAG: hypothetical protein A3F67_06045 [Verrucomicrobia bacterium RIFCSPHIGHO2_12_FULL_41_10]HLB33549.1 type II secretion system protein [Chthoniobacterales bacterium]
MLFASLPPTSTHLPPPSRKAAFTLLEIVLAMTIFGLLAGAIYTLSTASIHVTREILDEQLTVRRLEGFLTITRNAFLNLPAHGTISLSTEGNETAIPDLNFEHAASLFGLPSLGGGTLVLSARARNDGTRTFSILLLPKNLQGEDRDRYYQGEHWIPLLPKVNKPHWSFFRNGEWLEEWPQGTGRPQLARLQMEVLGINHSVDAIFYIPPIGKTIFQPTTDDSMDGQSAQPNSQQTPSPTSAIKELQKLKEELKKLKEDLQNANKGSQN